MAASGVDETPAALPELVADAVDRLAERLRRFGSRHWREPLGPDGATAADVVHALVVDCARQDAELRGAALDDTAVPDRPDYDAALADRLAVSGRELADALRSAPDSTAEAALGRLLAAARVLRISVDR